MSASRLGYLSVEHTLSDDEYTERLRIEAMHWNRWSSDRIRVRDAREDTRENRVTKHKRRLASGDAAERIDDGERQGRFKTKDVS